MSVTRTLLLMVVVCAATAQAPHIGHIDFYGLHKVTAEKILQTTHMSPGGALPPSKGDLEEEIGSISGVVAARVEAVCCDGAAVDLFIGIEEQGAPHTAFRSAPSGSAAAPQELLDMYQDFLAAVQRAELKGTTGEDMSAGHSLMADPAVRAVEERFVTYAANRVDLLRSVLRNGSVAEERAVAAAAIGYASRKAEVVDDLQYAVDDPDEAVRVNAMRSLTAIGVLAQKKPDLGIKLSATWFVVMLHSLALSDRVEAVKALVTLTDGGNRAPLDLIRERALPDLLEMAQWKTLRYALPPFLLLGRVAGLKDADIHQSWEKGDRQAVIEKAMPPGRKRG